MFQGRAELFYRMVAESWVAGQTAHPSPVLRLDMSRFRGSRGPEELNALLAEAIRSRPCLRGLELAGGRRARDALASAIEALHERKGPVVVLVDEYDAPRVPLTVRIASPPFLAGGVKLSNKDRPRAPLSPLLLLRPAGVAMRGSGEMAWDFPSPPRGRSFIARKHGQWRLWQL